MNVTICKTGFHSIQYSFLYSAVRTINIFFLQDSYIRYMNDYVIKSADTIVNILEKNGVIL